MKKMHLIAAAAATASLAFAASAHAQVVYGLTTDNSIDVVNVSDPSNSIDGGFVMGLTQNEALIDIDFRPGTGELYAISSQDNVYTIDTDTFQATLLGNFGPPSLQGTSFAFDFNNQFDGGSGDPADIGRFARIISNVDTNRVIDGDTGQYLGMPDKTPVFYAAGDVNAGEDPNIVGIAYTNAFAGASSTQQFGIDRNTGALVTVANNAGTLETVGDIGVTLLSNEAALDIYNVDEAYAVLQPGPNSLFYSVDLDTGIATELDVFGSGDIIRSIAIEPIPEPATIGLLAAAGLGLIRRR